MPEPDLFDRSGNIFLDGNFNSKGKMYAAWNG